MSVSQRAIPKLPAASKAVSAAPRAATTAAAQAPVAGPEEDALNRARHSCPPAEMPIPEGVGWTAEQTGRGVPTCAAARLGFGRRITEFHALQNARPRPAGSSYALRRTTDIVEGDGSGVTSVSVIVAPSSLSEKVFSRRTFPSWSL